MSGALGWSNNGKGVWGPADSAPLLEELEIQVSYWARTVNAGRSLNKKSAHQDPEELPWLATLHVYSHTAILAESCCPRSLGSGQLTASA